MDGALETVEIVCLAAHDDLKGFVVIIAAMFANGHRTLSLDFPIANQVAQRGVPVGYSRIPSGAQILYLLPEPKVSEYEKNNDNCSDQPNDSIHEVLSEADFVALLATSLISPPTLPTLLETWSVTLSTAAEIAVGELDEVFWFMASSFGDWGEYEYANPRFLTLT